MDLSRLGVFAFLDGLTAAESVEFAQTVERLGYSALWIVEAGGRDALTHAGLLLAHTDRLIVASGVASIWGREPTQMACAARAAAEGSDGRFILGLGSNNPLSMQFRGLPYDKPVTTMREYVRRVREATYLAPAPPAEPPVVIAANNPKMLEVARVEAHGTITYIHPVEHTAAARAALGPQPWLCVTQAALLETDPRTARGAARAYLSTYLPHIDAYVRSYRRFGFTDADFADGLSDRLVDAVVAWGDVTAVQARIAAHREAGATHVCVLPLGPGGSLIPNVEVLEGLRA